MKIIKRSMHINKTAIGTVEKVSRQWWLKVNTQAMRILGGNGAQYPHIISVKYSVGVKEYTKRKWLSAGKSVPEVGKRLTVSYCEDKPAKAIIEL